MSGHKYLRKLLADAVSEGFTLECLYGGETDYSGTDVSEALEALTACDVMELRLTGGLHHKGNRALIIPELEPDEQIADYSGAWIDKWWEENVR